MNEGKAGKVYVKKEEIEKENARLQKEIEDINEQKNSLLEKLGAEKSDSKAKIFDSGFKYIGRGVTFIVCIYFITDMAKDISVRSPEQIKSLKDVISAFFSANTIFFVVIAILFFTNIITAIAAGWYFLGKNKYKELYEELLKIKENAEK